jgi:hypothetical protein
VLVDGGALSETRGTSLVALSDPERRKGTSKRIRI